jgi:hypothetical protein
MTASKNLPQGIKAMEGEMKNWESVPVAVAVLLAMAAAMMSSSPTSLQEFISFSAEALKPNIADLGQDPGYLAGTAATTNWLPPPRPDPVVASKN